MLTKTILVTYLASSLAVAIKQLPIHEQTHDEDDFYGWNEHEDVDELDNKLSFKQDVFI